jgi:hypothetical protein
VPLGAASDTITRAVRAHAEVATRTSLSVSTQVLQFTVPDPARPAVATVDFVAGVRTHVGAEVVLTVETASLPGAAGRDSSLTFAGDGEGTLGGAMVPAQSSIVGRWVGSGRRSGRIAFALQGPAAGIYSVPLRFVLSVP